MTTPTRQAVLEETRALLERLENAPANAVTLERLQEIREQFHSLRSEVLDHMVNHPYKNDEKARRLEVLEQTTSAVIEALDTYIHRINNNNKGATNK